MFFQVDMSSYEQYMPFIWMAGLILADILILKIGLVITKAKVKKEIKWVVGSFFIQFGIIFFIFTPFVLSGSLGEIDFKNDLPVELILSLIFAVFIDLQVINVLHQLGLKKSFVVVILIMIPMTIALFILATNIGGILFP